MIQAAMMFALGFSVCGLIALAASSALARRTRRLAEHRVKQRYATKRLEFETERDELRARHAVTVQRLEQDVRKLGDEATSYRLESALKDIEINALNSDVDDRDEEIEELKDRLDELHEELRDSDRKLAESGTALRAARHALQMKSAEDALGENPYAADDHVIAGDRAAEGSAESARPDVEIADAPDSTDAVNIRKVASEIRRIAGETEAEVRHLPLPAHAAARRRTEHPAADKPVPADPVVTELPPAHPDTGANGSASGIVEMFDPMRREIPPAQSQSSDSTIAESRFLQAMEQIRTLKKASGSNAAE
jgi:uncharacterized coiled-coil protein SlyX